MHLLFLYKKLKIGIFYWVFPYFNFKSEQTLLSKYIDTSASSFIKSNLVKIPIVLSPFGSAYLTSSIAISASISGLADIIAKIIVFCCFI